MLEAHAALYRDLGQYDVAMADAAHAVQEAPARPAVYFLRCQIDFEAAQYQAAASDCGSYLHIAPTDGYGVIWMAMSLARDKQDLGPAFATLDRIDTSYWPGPLIDLYRGNGTPERQGRMVPGPVRRRRRRQKGPNLRTDFYGGEWHLIRGETAAAKAMLAAVPGECPKDYVEIDGAKAELARLKYGALMRKTALLLVPFVAMALAGAARADDQPDCHLHMLASLDLHTDASGRSLCGDERGRAR